jgi:hypothetical protein
MSYLNPLRLHFAGQFQASISTVNNISTNFDTSSFDQASWQINSDTGLFNPWGDAAWRLIGCRVTNAFMPSGLPDNDPIKDCLVADSDSRVCAKLVDLDSEQQLVSTIWGLQVRITDAQGATLLRGSFEPAAFMDIWSRSLGGSSDIGAGAMWQSVLTDLQWGDLSASPFLQALLESTLSGPQPSGVLSIKFNVDAMDLGFQSPDFMRGRITGTIGPASANDPKHFVRGRQLEAIDLTPQGFLTPKGLINWCVASVDESQGKVFLDLGNALPTTGANNTLVNLGDLTLQTLDGAVIIGTLPSSIYTQNSWYAKTAGVVALPATGRLTEGQLKSINTTSLSLTGKQPGTNRPVNVTETPTGKYVRADQFVFRMNPLPGEPDNQVQANLFATQFGSPLTGTIVNVTRYTDQLQPQVATVGDPADAISFPATTQITDNNGRTVLTIRASDPKNPRDYIDGQVYGVAVSLPGMPAKPHNPYLFISLLVWDAFTPSGTITWNTIKTIFTQYANLYPVMSRFMDLSNEEQVIQNAGLLALAFGLDVSDPNSMPVTRDLSWAKRQAILTYLNNLLNP